MLHEWLHILSEAMVAAVDLMALLLISGASFYVFGRTLLLVFRRRTTPDGREFRALWLVYARWLVAGLTFQLAADIIESSISPSWEAIAMLGAIAVIRTFLNYFLGRDMDEMRELNHRSSGGGVARE